MSLERCLDDAALNTTPAPMDEPDFEKARRSCCFYIVCNNGRHVLRRKRVKIDLCLDRDADGGI
jgi:hypothetical protein